MQKELIQPICACGKGPFKNILGLSRHWARVKCSGVGKEFAVSQLQSLSEQRETMSPRPNVPPLQDSDIEQQAFKHKTHRTMCHNIEIEKFTRRERLKLPTNSAGWKKVNCALADVIPKIRDAFRFEDMDAAMTYITGILYTTRYCLCVEQCNDQLTIRA